MLATMRTRNLAPDRPPNHPERAGLGRASDRLGWGPRQPHSLIRSWQTAELGLLDPDRRGCADFRSFVGRPRRTLSGDNGHSTDVALINLWRAVSITYHRPGRFGPDEVRT
jgi:hypothetical protein